MLKQPLISLRYIAFALFIFNFSCKKAPKCTQPVSREYEIGGFKNVSASKEFAIAVKICPGEKSAIIAKGCAEDIADLEFIVSDSLLDLRFDEFRSKRHMIELEITAPIRVGVNFFKNPKVKVIDNPH